MIELIEQLLKDLRNLDFFFMEELCLGFRRFFRICLRFYNGQLVLLVFKFRLLGFCFVFLLIYYFVFEKILKFKILFILKSFFVYLKFFVQFDFCLIRKGQRGVVIFLITYCFGDIFYIIFFKISSLLVVYFELLIFFECYIICLKIFFRICLRKIE